jgi:hypothetical protein
MDAPQLALSLLVAVGLAAASGLRIFVPALVAGLAARAGALPLTADFQWLASTPALVALGLATAVELAAYSVPWLDHALDVVATPVAILGGFLLSAAVLTELDPLLRWSLALVVGGGAAAAVQIPSAIARGVSTWTTGGVANPAVAASEAAGSTFVSVAAVLAPLLLVVVVVLALLLVASRRREARALRARS